jgi:ribosomal protein S18 acetylase RimI-like enzyme
MSMTAPKRSGWIRLPWDSDHFGFEIGRILEPELRPGELWDEIKAAQEAGIQCLYWLTSQNSLSILRRYPAIKMLDSRVVYRRGLQSHTDRFDPTSIQIRIAERQDLGALLGLASVSHTNTRFYQDDSFPIDRARSLYSRWIEKAMSDPDQVVLVSGSPGQPAAYITCGPSAAPGVAAIGLVAVASDQRRLGLAQQLVWAVMRWARERGFEGLEVVTQGHNLPAQRLYEGIGFDFVDENTWVHIWLNGWDLISGKLTPLESKSP